MTCGAWVLVLGARGLGLKARVNNRTTGDNILVYESNFGDLSRLGSGSALLLKQYREGCLSSPAEFLDFIPLFYLCMHFIDLCHCFFLMTLCLIL
jgi:hypothetical protein